MRICALLLCLTMSSCSSLNKDIPRPQPASESLISTEERANSRVSASAEVIKKANELNSNENSKTAIDAEADLIQITTGMPTPADYALAKARLDSYIQGKTKEAEQLRAAAEMDARNGRKEIDELKKKHAKEISESKAEIAALKAKSEEERKENVTLWFALVGSVLASIGALSVAFSPWKQGGAILIGCGILIGGSGLMWDNIWFKVIVLSSIAIGAAFGAYQVYKKFKKS